MTNLIYELISSFSGSDIFLAFFSNNVNLREKRKVVLVHAIKLCGEVVVQLYSFLITALDAGEVFAFTPPAAPYPTKKNLAGHHSRYENYGEETNLFPTLVWIHDCLQNVFKYLPLISRTTLFHGVTK